MQSCLAVMVHNAWGRGGSALERGRSRFSAIRNFPVVSAQGKKFPRKSGHIVPGVFSQSELLTVAVLLRRFRVGIGWTFEHSLRPPNQQISALRAAQRNMWWGLIKNLLPLPTEPPHCFLVN